MSAPISPEARALCERYGFSAGHGTACVRYTEHTPEAGEIIAALREKLAEAERENAELRKALQFYADEKNWHNTITVTVGLTPDGTPKFESGVLVDDGRVARAALKKEKP